MVLIAVMATRWARPVPPKVVVRTERVEVPVIQERVLTRTVYRERPPVMVLVWHPVRELRPRIIRSGNDQN